MKNKLIKKLMLPVLLFVGSIMYGQNVTGTVSDASGPLPGVSVNVKGTSTGTETDFDGNYSLPASQGDVLVFRSLGYQTVEKSVTGGAINVTLSEDSTQLDEIVVIGYGTTTVKDATGSLTAVTAEDFNGGAISSPEQLIQGKAAGVQITQSSGEPGAGITLRIRGTGSVRANNSPLFVIDGVPVSNESVSATGADIGAGSGGSKNPLNFLNPNDIESMSILKDASATAIYGSRGANGVVVITTKSGKGNSKGQWNFTNNVTTSTTLNTYDLLTAQEFIAKGGANLGGATDWQDVIFRTALSTDTNISYAKSYEKGNVRATFGYVNQEGVIQDTELERITGRVNLNHRFLKDKLKLSFQGTLSRINDQAPFVTREAGSTGDLLASAYYSNPTLPNNPDFNTAPDRNPANLLAYYDDTTQTDRFLGNLSLDYAISDDLSAKASFGMDNSTSSRGQILGPQAIGFDRASGKGVGAISNLDTSSKLFEFTVNYKKEFENSRLDALVGYSYQDFTREGQNIEGQGFSTNNLSAIRSTLENAFNSTRGIASNYQAYGVGTFLDTKISQMRVLGLNPNISDTVLATPGIPVTALVVDTFDFTDEIQSFFGRVNYTIADKYLFTATIRADGSSKFGDNNKYGIFPSAAFAWKMNEEDFVGEAFSTLKLRLNWGITGNQDGLGHGQYLNRTRWKALAINAGSEIQTPATTEVAFANPDLKWESTTQYGVGFDFGFSDDRLTGTLDFYRKETRDLLLNLPSIQPATTPFNFQNIDAVLVNQGVEFGLGYDILSSDDLTWNANFNIAYNKNELTQYEGPNLQAGNLYGQGLSNATAQVLTNGKSLFTYNLRKVNGTTVDASPTILDKSGLPDITTGLSTSVSYKNFDASLFFSGQFGHYVYNNTANALFASPQIGSRNNLTSVVNGGVTLSATNPSEYFLEKGDFIRLQSASIGYNVPLNDNSAVKSLRFSLSGQNLFLITDYSGLDPEVSSTITAANGLPSASIDYVSYPRPRTFTFGVNLNF